jgi:hypothetical protein
MANNYSLVDAERRWRADDYPAHHQWGAVPLRVSGAEVRFLPFSEGRIARRINARIGGRWGDPVAQLRAITTKADVLLGAAPFTLATLVRLGSRPTVGIMHSAAATEPSRRRVMLGYDAVVCLSETIRRDLLELGRAPDTTLVAPWGPDLDFAGYGRPTGDDGSVFTSGKTLRDHDVVRAASAACGAELTVHDVGGEAPYREILDQMSVAGIVAISVRRGATGMFGVTELNDALALGKPVVMSRNPYIDLDIEAEGCGLVVEPGDSDEWTTALRSLLADPDRRAEMGRRGRAVAEERWNHTVFGAAVIEAVSLALRGSESR